MKRWLYKGDDARIFYDEEIDKFLDDGWTKRPQAKDEYADLTLTKLRALAKDKKILGYGRADRETLIKQLKDTE